MLKDTMYLTWWTRGKRIMACVRNAQGRPHDHIADDATWRSETIHGVAYDLFFHEFLVDQTGAGFILFKEPQHTAADVDRAKRALRNERDVARIQVIQIDEWLEAAETPRVAYFPRPATCSAKCCTQQVDKAGTFCDEHQKLVEAWASDLE